MEIKVYEHETFENIDFSEKELLGYEYLKCDFINCNFSKVNLKNTDLIDCNFTGCNFSLALLGNTGLKGVKFISCKLVGVNFNVCSNFLFSVAFTDCHLDYSTFFQRKMKKTVFTGCSLKEVDFEEADLTQVVFNNCDLFSTHFFKTILEKADLRTAINYSFDPELNKIKKAKFSHQGIGGLLAKYDIEIE